MALDLQHEKVRLVRIACGAFVLGAEGKVKLTHLAGSDSGEGSRGAATRRLINGFIGHAVGGSLSAG